MNQEPQIDPAFVAEINEAQRLRGWIVNAYAQIEYCLGDLVLRCREFPEYDAETKKFSDRASDLAGKVRSMLARPGPLAPFAVELLAIVDGFDQGNQTRNLLAHGLCQFLHTPAGDTGMRFQKWHRVPGRDNARLIRDFRLNDLRLEEESFVALSQTALTLFMRVHNHFGWIARPES